MKVVVPFFIPHLGCPHRCVFCDQEKVAGSTGGLPSPDELLTRIAQYAEKARGRDLEVAFYGGTFTALPRADQERLLFPLQPLLATGTLESLRVSTRPDSVDDDTASFLKERGVATVELGVQSMDAEVLRLSGRGHDAADVEAAVAALKKAGIAVGIQLMPGLPGDSPARSLDSLSRVLALSPSFLRIYPTLVISGTELSRMYLAGSYKPLSLPEAVSICKDMLAAANREGVQVIRMGLQPTAELEAPGVVLAGPYHPAFRQLVESELRFDQMIRLLSAVPRGSRVTFVVPRGKTSDLVGQKRENLSRVSRLFAAKVVAVREDPSLPPGSLSLEWDGGSMSIGL